MSFSGTVESDFIKFSKIPEERKPTFINFAATDFQSLKGALIDYIKSVYPEDFNSFYSSELGMMLVELVAYMGAVTSFKTDALANECFLRTVKTRNNLIKLLELIGVSLRGPSSASARGQLEWAPVGAGTSVPSPFSFSPANRVVSLASPEDGSPVTYTLYKLDSNDTIEQIADPGDTLEFTDTDANNSPLNTLYSNMALVEGTFIVESGSFSTAERVKTIALTTGPVIEKSVRIFVEELGQSPNDATGPYVGVDKLFSASGPTDKIFELAYDDDFNATVIFGDGTFSQNPPANSTYTVTYRVGGGSRGNLEKEAINAIVTDVAGNEWRLENITPMTGGRDAETFSEAKRYGPYTFKTQDRLVTLQDYAAFVNRFQSSTGNSAKGIALTRDAYSSGNIIDLFVLEKATALQFQKASPTYKKDLLEAVQDLKMVTDQVVVNDGLIRSIDLSLTVTLDKAYKEIAEQIKLNIGSIITSFFEVGEAEFGKDFVKVELERAIFNLPQIRFTTIENIPDVIYLDPNELIQLNNFDLQLVFI